MGEPTTASTLGALIAIVASAAWAAAIWVSAGDIVDVPSALLVVVGPVVPVIAVSLLCLARLVSRALAAGFVLGTGGLLLASYLSRVASDAMSGSLTGYDWTLPAAAAIVVLGGILMAIPGRTQLAAP